VILSNHITERLHRVYAKSLEFDEARAALRRPVIDAVVIVLGFAYEDNLPNDDFFAWADGKYMFDILTARRFVFNKEVVSHIGKWVTDAYDGQRNLFANDLAVRLGQFYGAEAAFSASVVEPSGLSHRLRLGWDVRFSDM